MINPFVLPAEKYKRDLNILNHYLKDASTYLSLMTGKPLEECIDYVKHGSIRLKDVCRSA